MKKIGMTILLAALIFQCFNRDLSAENQDIKKQGTTVNKDENTKVSIGKDLLSVEESDSSINVRVGNRGLNILESLEGSKFKFERYNKNDETDQEDKEEDRARRRNRFKGHWAGVEFGFNNYLTSDRSSVMPADINYMTLHTSKSNNFSINFAQLSLGFARHFGILTGLGINWNNYRFSGNNNITTTPLGVIVELDPGGQLDKSKLTTVYLTIPVMLELQIPANSHHLNLGAGFIGASKLGAHTKMKYENGDKVKSNEALSLNQFRYGATARIGYENFQLYGTYYMTPLFLSGKGPNGNDLYPFEIGVAITFNN
jgi:hypothetical protein